MNSARVSKGHRFVALGARIYLATIFLVACVHKIASPSSFAVDIATYQIVPLSSVNLMALILPWIELVAAILLALGWRTRAAALLITLMMSTFTVAVAIALAKGLDMSCGCFASEAAGSDPISGQTILRDAGWLVLALYIFVFDRQPLGLDAVFARRAHRVNSQKGSIP